MAVNSIQAMIVPKQKTGFEWRDPLVLPPLTAFDLPKNHERPPKTALGEYIFRGVQKSRMAGHLLKPKFVEFCE